MHVGVTVAVWMGAGCTSDDAPVRVPPDTTPTPELISCEAPTEGLEFERTVLPAQAPMSHRLVGSGFVAADLTGDGRLELLAPGPTEWVLWSLDEDGSWVDISDSWLGDAPPRGVGGSAADVDADGDLDVLVTSDGEPDHLYRNDGDRLVDITDEAGIVTGPWRTMSASWADVDADGDLDLYLGGYGVDDPGTLWLNDGLGYFTDGSDRLPGQAVTGYTFSSAFHDLQADGFPDLFVPNDFPGIQPHTSLLANRGELWVNDTDSRYHPGFSGMGIVLTDLNDDGLPDPIESTFRAVSVMRSYPDPAAEQGLVYIIGSGAVGLGGTGTPQQVFGWGIDAGDLDHDGAIELAVAFGHWDFETTANAAEQVDSLYSWDPATEHFDRLVADHDPEPTRGLLLVDVDGDGWLDRVKRTLDGELWVDHRACGERAWLEVTLADTTQPNVHGIGATVRVSTEPEQLRWVEAGSRSMFVGGPPVVHFGLDQLEVVDVEVVWPDLTVTRIDDVPTRQRLTVTR